MQNIDGRSLGLTYAHVEWELVGVTSEKQRAIRGKGSLRSVVAGEDSAPVVLGFEKSGERSRV